LGQKLVDLFRRKDTTTELKDQQDSEHTPLLDSPTADHHQDEETLSTNASIKPTELTPPESKSTLKKIFTLETSLYILAYFFIACHCVSFDQLLPVFLSTQPAVSLQRPPFKIWGGLGLTASQIGVVFSLSGLTTMFVELVIFPPVTKRLGSLRVMRIISPFFPFAYAAMPYVLILPQSWQEGAVVSIAFVRWVCGAFAFPCITILLVNSASDSKILGTLNGIATTASALGRCAGPAGFGGLFSIGLKMKFGVLPWFVMALVACLGTIPLTYSKDKDEQVLKSCTKHAIKSQNKHNFEGEESNADTIDRESIENVQRI